MRDLLTITETRLDDLPPMADLMARAAAVANRAKARRTAPIGEEFTGPILVEGQASAELLRQTLVPLTLARRAPDAENPRFAQPDSHPLSVSAARASLWPLGPKLSSLACPAPRRVRASQ